MGMPAPLFLPTDPSRHDWTVEERNALPADGKRYEVIDGELLVTPAPALMHQRAALELGVLLKPYAAQHDSECVIAPADVTFSPRRVVEPDLFVLPLLHGKLAQRFEDVGRLVLVVEVLSPSSVRVDRYVKRRLYQSERVAEYWIVEPEARLVERWRPDDEEPEVVVDTLSWAPRGSADPLVIDLPSYFRRVHGEELAKG
ncbi:MAG: Uma2 family endonuclease [Gemmatimonadaceae bacterium]|nr:Uma2 family endonuclease [Gemmatimonadaceae bacterium]